MYPSCQGENAHVEAVVKAVVYCPLVLSVHIIVGQQAQLHIKCRRSSCYLTSFPLFEPGVILKSMILKFSLTLAEPVYFNLLSVE